MEVGSFKHSDTGYFQALVKEMQERFLGKLWPLCQPFGPNATNCQKAREVQLKIQSVGFCQASSIILTHLLDYVSDESWTELLKLMAERESLDVKNFGKLNVGLSRESDELIQFSTSPFVQ